MDKRVLKTKKALKETLLQMLREQDFDSIKTTEICERAMVSRNTFYNNYSDKYALLADCFSDYEQNFLTRFRERQAKSSSGQDIRQGFLDLVDTFLDMEELYHPVAILSNFDLMELYYQAMMHILAEYEKSYADTGTGGRAHRGGGISPDYDLSQLNSFLVLGFWGFIHGNPKLSRDEIRARSKKLVTDLLESPIFRRTS